MKRLILPFFALVLCLTACSQEPAQQQFFAMDTIMSITAYGKDAEEAVASAVVEVNALESLLSRTREGSDINLLNSNKTAVVSEDTVQVLSLALEWNRKTNGAFDVTIAPVVAAWGFGGAENHQVPSQEELNELLRLVDSSALTLNGFTATLEKTNMEVDLGGIAKGYAASQAEQVLRSHGVESALLDLGHNITVIGSKPDGSAWRIAVQDPADGNSIVGVLSLQDCSAVTSGGYQRYFEQDGQVYHHIVDPRTGYPADSGIVSATAICSDSALADLLSTAVFVLGVEDALTLWRTEGGFDLVLVTDDNTVVITEGLIDAFELDQSSGYTLEYVKN